MSGTAKTFLLAFGAGVFLTLFVLWAIPIALHDFHVVSRFWGWSK